MAKLHWKLATEIHKKDNAYKVIEGKAEGDALEATRTFAAAARNVHRLARVDTLCLMGNVKVLQQQTSHILKVMGRDNEVVSLIMPLAQALHVHH